MLESVRLVDHHCHGVVGGPLERAGFELLATESDRPAPPGCSALDSQLGFAIRRRCAPLLGLAPHAPAEEYLQRRDRLGPAEVNRRLLTAAGVGVFLVDTGYRAADLLTPAQLAQAAGAQAREVVRLEAVAERVAAGGVTAEGFAAAYADALATATVDAVAVKSVLAYRHGLDIGPGPPTAREVRTAAGRWLRGTGGAAPRQSHPAPPGAGLGRAGASGARCSGRVARGAAQAAAGLRLDEPVLLRHVLWAGVERGLPVQVHTGFGDPDLDLARADPALLTGFLRAVRDRGVAVMLLHCYPYHRQAGYLAQVFPHVYLDVGLALNHVGARAAAVLAESLELAPFHKVLYSSDAFGLPELHLLGAVQFREALTEVLDGWVAAGRWSDTDARRVAAMIGAGNAERVYRMGHG
ncbi:amidohydrolase family protein [Krasilnikovia sp. M28-CT-15]|uniref:amidohydrolase family protein n=1 Tax=Krasilnikovia sp. M28-CT-15 TaxID=3373540 RepID=UPI0038777E31